MGKRHIRRIASLLQNLLSHLILASIAPEHAARTHWLIEASAFQFQLRNRITPALMAQVELDHLWTRSVSEILVKAAEIGASGCAGGFAEEHSLNGPRCPFSLQDLCAEDFNPREMADRLAATSR